MAQKYGGQSTVTFVENADKSARGALKVLKNGNQKRGLIRERRARMRREVVALETLKGASGIPFVLDHNTEFFEVLSIDLYVVQEFIEGKTLGEYIDGPLSISEATRITIALCELIRKCHDANVLHRDIKPENIIVDPSGCIWLVDFGLTYIEQNDSFQTDTDQEIGNRFLRLPEHASGRRTKYARQSDLTLICGIFFKLLTGHRPSGLVDENSLPPHLSPHSPVQDEVKADPRWPRIKSIFDVGFSVSISLRFSTAEELLSRLKEIDDPPRSTVSAGPEAVESEYQKLASHIATERFRLRESLKQLSRELHAELVTMANGKNLSPRSTGYGTQVMKSVVVLGFQLAESYDSHLSAPLVHYIRILGPNLEFVEASYATTYELAPASYPEPYYRGLLSDIEQLRAAVELQKYAIFALLLQELNRLLEGDDIR